ncbi:hypothetical protein AGMMS49936_11420 [Endomicrobiia bacterium]|nr:hypothetical protein AGMMS49936_11420 [Endomicrobiia bacterium]
MRIGIVKQSTRSRSSSDYATDAIERPKKNSESGKARRKKTYNKDVGNSRN